MTPTVRDSTPTAPDSEEWDILLDESSRSGRFGPLRLGPLPPADAALLKLLLSKRLVERAEVGDLLGRSADDSEVEAAVDGLRMQLPLLAATRIVRVGTWGFRYRRPTGARSNRRA